MSFIVSIVVFAVVLTILVFVHEMGHYMVARWRGVRVETFSVGFGPEIVGWRDSAGTRWRVSWLPLGGYVKFFGDFGVASKRAQAERLTPAERTVSFHHKSLGSRVAIVAAGPLANFAFAIFLLAGLYATSGQPFSPPVIAAVEPDSPAATSGFRAGDRLVEINGVSVDRFEDLMQFVLANPGHTLTFVLERDGVETELSATPGTRVITDRAGIEREIGYLGVRSSGYEIVRHNLIAAMWFATKQTVFIAEQTMIAAGRMITGRMATDDLRGPIGIAQLSGQVAQIGLVALIEFTALISISLGLINLFPIPLLDGGHLLFYAIEFVRGKPLGERAQEFGFRIGLVLVVMLMILATWNDIAQLPFVARMREYLF